MLRPWHHSLSLDKTSSLSIHQQLTEHFHHMIVHGEWLADSALPSTRDIAQQLGINRKTVARVYDELLALGLIYTQPKRGTFVSAQTQRQIQTSPNNVGYTYTVMSDRHLEIQQLIQKTVLQHTRRAALHLHKLQQDDFDQGGLHLLRQMLANQLTHEKKLLVAPHDILCSTWLALEHTVFHLLQQRQGALLLDAVSAARLGARLQQYRIETLILPASTQASTTGNLIDQIEKFCINYPVSTLWLDSTTLHQVATEKIQRKLAQRIQDYQLLLIEDMRYESPHAGVNDTMTAMLTHNSLLLGSLYGQYCDMFNLHYLACHGPLQPALIAQMDSLHQQSQLLNMLAHSELLKRGDYKKLMHRIQQLVQTAVG